MQFQSFLLIIPSAKLFLSRTVPYHTCPDVLYVPLVKAVQPTEELKDFSSKYPVPDINPIEPILLVCITTPVTRTPTLVTVE